MNSPSSSCNADPKIVTRALISVSDKTNIVPFAKSLSDLKIEILSTGGTFKLLKENNIPVIEVSDYTQFPEMMDGRVKTLHPKIHGGILGRRGIDNEIMEQHQITPIDLVVVNLYPFQATIAQDNCDLPTAIENIDIGGPTMVRAAAKNHKDVAIIVNNSDYEGIIKTLETNQNQLDYALRFDLAVKAFEHTANYDAAIANYLGKQISLINDESEFPRTFNQQFIKQQDMRYGENPHQNAAFYKEHQTLEASVSTAISLQGKALSYNNIADTDSALETVKQFTDPACVIVKHANPCGVATASNQLDAYNLAYATDPTSAFGGIIAFNQPLEKATAQSILDKQFVEVIIAPEITEEAKAVLANKPNIRVLSCGALPLEIQTDYDFKRVTGGLLVQDKDIKVITEADLNIVSKRQPTQKELSDLLFAWKVAKFVKSNAIVYAKNLQTIGIGAGQMSRVYSAKIAGIKASDENLIVADSVMASDAFFPFRDGIDAAAEAGIVAVIQPGGSMRDDEVIAAANEANMAMVFTGIRHFRH